MHVLLALAAAAPALWAHGLFARSRRPHFRLALRLFASGALGTAALLALAERPALAAAAAPLVAGATVAALVAWTGLTRLVSFEARTRDRVVRAILLGFAGIGVAAAWEAGAVATLAILGTLAWRWKRELHTRSRFTVGLGALALGFMLVVHTAHTLPGTPGAAVAAAHAFARVVLATAAAHALLGAFALLRAWVSDPSLGIRRVSRRLALSHTLVGLVPVLLLGGMWAATTVLGVVNERAIVGARAVDAQARAGAALLRGALAPRGDAPPRLAAVARLTGVPGTRVWWRDAARGAALVRVAGDSVPGESRIGAWLDSLPPLPGAGVVRLADSLYLGAAVATPDGGAVLLEPLRPALRTQADSIARSRLYVYAGSSVRSMDGAVSVGGGRDPSRGARAQVDSADLERVRGTLRRFGVPDSAVTAAPARGPQASLTAGGDTLHVSHTGPGFLLQGHALAKGITARGDGWAPVDFILSADTPPRLVLAGLGNDMRTNPLGIIPLVLLALFAGLALLVAAWDLAMVRGMGGSITCAVDALDHAAARLRDGDLSHRITIAGDDDLWQVASAFNTATDGLERAREAEQERARIEGELDVARRIQARLLPAAPPRVPGLEIAGHYDPAREVGGDYYDHIALDDHRVLLAIADVSGKSVPAALIMAGFRAALVSQDLAHGDPPRLAERLNGFLNDSLDPGKFVTAFLAIVDGATGRLAYVNAGHNPPLLLRAGGTLETLEAGGTILGILPGSRYERGEATLGAGDLLVLYTDGVPEGTSPANELWGDDRLAAAVRTYAALPCDGVVRAIAGDVRAFEAGRGPADDVTLIALRRVTG